jgi:phage shock protein E
MKIQTLLLWLVLVASYLARPAWAEVPDEAVWVDVRSPAETASGHLQQAVLIPFDGIEAGVAELQLDKGTPIYLYCASGGRAANAKVRLEAIGFTDVTNVGGFDDAQALVGASPEG